MFSKSELLPLVGLGGVAIALCIQIYVAYSALKSLKKNKKVFKIPLTKVCPKDFEYTPNLGDITTLTDIKNFEPDGERTVPNPEKKVKKNVRTNRHAYTHFKHKHNKKG